MEWEEIPREDLEMKSFQSDTSVSAMVLGSYGEAAINDDFGFDYTVHVRIKIFSPAGYQYGTDVLSLYSYDFAEKLDDLEGATYALDDKGNVVKTELEDEMVFEEEVDDNHTRHRFTFPALKPGCVIEYRYNVIQKSMFYVRTWTFQNSIPVRWSEFRVIVPRSIAYARYLKGFESLAMNEETEVTRHYGGSAEAYLGSSLVRCAQYRWVMRDIPALTEEPYVATMDDYASSIDMQLAEYALHGAGSTKVLKSWPALTEDLLKDQDFGGMAEPTGRLRDLAAKVTTGATTPLARLVALYDYARKTIVWNGRMRMFGHGTAADLLDTKSGSSGSINLMLAALLRSAEIDAHPVILSTRKNGRITEDYPIVTQFNTTAVRARAGDCDLVLDATDPLRTYDLVPTSMLNVRGLVVKPGPVEWITITSPKRYVQRAAARLTVDTTGDVHGTLESSDLEYSALAKRKDLRDKKAVEVAKSVFSTEAVGLAVDSASVTDPDTLNAAFGIRAQVTGASYAQVSGDYIYINPAVIDRRTSSPFKNKVRKFPVDMSYRRAIVRVTNLTVPPGYEVKDLPRPVTLGVGAGDAKYERVAALDGRVIQVMMRQTFNTSLFPPRSYPYLKDFYDKIAAAESDQIVLKKVPAPPPPGAPGGEASKSVRPGKSPKRKTP
jgi:transglutaminase-like putative cysteine protease